MKNNEVTVNLQPIKNTKPYDRNTLLRKSTVKVGMLTIRDIARILNCSGRSIYRLVDAGRIPPPVKLGGMNRWPQQAFEAWIAQGCQPTKGKKTG